MFHPDFMFARAAIGNTPRPQKMCFFYYRVRDTVLKGFEECS